MTSNIELTMPRRPGRPVGGDAEATRRRILEAGQEIFADVGFEATTFMAIGNRAGVTRPAVNHYFSSKSVLYRTVLGVVTNRVAEAADTALRAPKLTNQLLGFIGEVIVSAEPSTVRFLLQSALDLARQPELATSAEHHPGATVDQFIRSAVNQAVSRGEVQADADSTALAEMFTAIFWGAALALGRTDTEAGRVMDQLRGLFDGSLFTR
jgi:AcrR family transcriptional regulator